MCMYGETEKERENEKKIATVISKPTAAATAAAPSRPCVYSKRKTEQRINSNSNNSRSSSVLFLIRVERHEQYKDVCRAVSVYVSQFVVYTYDV